MVAISGAWYNGSYTMAATPSKSLELHYTMIQFLVFNNRTYATTTLKHFEWRLKKKKGKDFEMVPFTLVRFTYSLRSFVQSTQTSVRSNTLFRRTPPFLTIFKSLHLDEDQTI